MNACSRDVSKVEVMARRCRADPSYALEMLCDVLQAGEIGDIQVLLRHVSLAFGHAPSPEAEHSLDYASITRILKENDRSHFSCMSAILAAAGLRVALRPAAPDQTAQSA